MRPKDALRVNNGRDLRTMHYPPSFVTAVIATDYEATTYLVKNIRKDACTKLASLGNKNVLHDFSILCNSQVFLPMEISLDAASLFSPFTPSVPAYVNIFLFQGGFHKMMMVLLLAGCAAATSIGFVGKYGVRQAGWMPICDHVSKFCQRVADSVMLSYLGVFFYLCLTIISANRSRHIQV
ncbi:CASP-like protein 1F1 [Nicotiana tabacum]|uniref:CASP-like protein 1F1 n=1 Tax=Nicotiana tabacum TaxID=4097 RepID=A0AC58TGE9_TOBAC